MLSREEKNHILSKIKNDGFLPKHEYIEQCKKTEGLALLVYEFLINCTYENYLKFKDGEYKITPLGINFLNQGGFKS